MRLVALLLLALSLSSCSSRGELYPIDQPTDVAGAHACLEHGFEWYTFEAGGVRCFHSEHLGTWNAELTLLERALDRS